MEDDALAQRAKPARPYICLLIIFKVTWNLTGDDLVFTV
jgi:hypothetical protein